LYYASARNQITVNSHLVPAILAIINPALSELAVKHVASFLHDNAYNVTAIDAALRCPQCLANPFVLKSVDLVPFDAPVASGSTMVGMIFVRTPSPSTATIDNYSSKSHKLTHPFISSSSSLSPSQSSKYSVPTAKPWAPNFASPRLSSSERSRLWELIWSCR
jgi:hypothetical protein